MRHPKETIASSFRRLLLREERGSAMTEFVIGLPIFVLIFIGMGTLHKLNSEALAVRMQANADLWENQNSTMTNMIPIVGGLTSISSFSDIATNGMSGLGMYVDSAAKAGLGNLLIGGTGIKAPANPPSFTIGGITNTQDTFANHLLNDMIDPTFDGSGFAGIAMSVVSTAGAAPALAAGMRYGAVEGSATRSFNHKGNSYNYDPGQLDLAAPTAAVHRIAAVGLTRLEMNREEPYKTAILEFDISVDTSGDPSVEEGTACSNDAQEYGDCIQQNGTGPFNGCSKPDDSCSDIGSGSMPEFDASWCTPPNCNYP